jgi:hypothetical protein
LGGAADARGVRSGDDTKNVSDAPDTSRAPYPNGRLRPAVEGWRS